MNVTAILLARVAAAEVERLKAEAAVISRRFAPRFNPVALLAPGETRLSDIFRWLLDDSETHGQGALFRDRFVSTLLSDEPSRWVGARVRSEVATADGRGRMDLVMQANDARRCVVIENKPWAGWQADQLPRYLADQSALFDEVRVLALIGSSDATLALEQHWADCSSTPLPSAVTASGFDEVAAWIDDCAQAARANSVRTFLYDLADYLRRAILSEASMNDLSDTADIILSGGEEALRAARAISAAVPLAMARDLAGRVNGSFEMVGGGPTVRLTVDGVDVNFALFGYPNPWAGVTDKARVDRLRGAITWAQPERLWPRWVYLKRVGEQGQALLAAVTSGDMANTAQRLPDVAKLLIGS